ncbi:hypothetical protein OJ997_15460 [Solirubrobacter phytolaccae]|uniref:Radical SAM protein n=1 Tax=Solirubrobacter phytolaccae TaxID=1404360 RepID=A0A9X3N8F2_9ACTN|nr:hypothetical protein [Solirubrobacter phytolaccae]MDA0181703.1 hypothetical protein [Solirubrobacter phytolaccae]
MPKPIDTDRFSKTLRERLFDPATREVLIAYLPDSHEAEDAYTKINCAGYGRIRTYENYTLHLRTRDHGARPMFRGHPPQQQLRTQVFQLAGCNWRCWYCFVDDDRLSGNRKVSRFFTAEQLVEMYLGQPHPPGVLDLSGGQPDLVPEWTLWTMQALEERGLRGATYVWSDDNLSTRYLWEHLSSSEIEYMATFPRHSRVGCFKGFDPASFAHTSGAEPELFDRQFDVFRDLLAEGFDLYAYATFTGPLPSDPGSAVASFVDRLQEIHPNLPLRTVPLRIHPFATTQQRLNPSRRSALTTQHEVYDHWDAELAARFSDELLQLPSDEVVLA